MHLFKRIGAILAIVVLISLYGIGFIAALLNKPYANQVILASIIATTLIPVLIYMFYRFHLLTTNKQDLEDDSTE